MNRVHFLTGAAALGSLNACSACSLLPSRPVADANHGTRLGARSIATMPVVRKYPVTVYGDCMNNGSIAATAAQLQGAAFDGGSAVAIHRTPRAYGAANLQAAFQWYQNNGSGEKTIANTGTISATLEYPLGTMTPLTFNGASSIVISSGDLVYSDPVLPSGIPPNTMYYIHTFVQIAAGGIIPVGISSGAVFPNDNFHIRGNNNYLARGGNGTNITNVTASNMTVRKDGYYSYGPITVVGDLIGAPATLPYVAVCGDSWAHGGMDVGMGGGIARALEAASIPFVRCAQGSEGAWAFANPSLRANRMVWVSQATSVFFEYGTNDIPTTYSSGNYANWYRYFSTALKAAGSQGAALFVLTYQPRTTSTDGWTTAANQTGIGGGGYYAVASRCNTYFRAPASSGTGNALTADMAAWGLKLGSVVDIATAFATDSLNTPPQFGVVNPNADRYYAPTASTPCQGVTGALTYDGLHLDAAAHTNILMPIMPIAQLV